MANGKHTAGDGARVRPRPPLFRALGAAEPPEVVEVAGVHYRRTDVLKHDSWAATAIYEGPRGKIVCKFNRQQSILGFPMGWLGRLLARREIAMLQRLADLPNIPPATVPVLAEGKPMPHVAAHVYIPGHPLGDRERVGDRFFPELESVLLEMHRRGTAYVDLHKRENVLVGKDGRPYLIDFQISLALPRWWPGNSYPLRAVLAIFQQSDLYHLRKHRVRCRPDQLSAADRAAAGRLPWWIRLHRFFARPYRTLRRRLLVALRIRSGAGQVTSEHFPEDVVRSDAVRVRQSA